ncbi:MAG: hypothetical protein PHF11_04655 [Candidatus Omnitrophica bacterium]|nr:hypothetical protein [Candidatus Omnitrophota bacterium]
MKKTITAVLVILMLTALCSFALAQESKESTMGKSMMQGPETSGQAMMTGDKKMMGPYAMCRMMCSMMAGKAMIATGDGGVIVLMGNKLSKYDNDLSLVKEVEIKMDTEGMQKMMGDMMEKCPMKSASDEKETAKAN